MTKKPAQPTRGKPLSSDKAVINDAFLMYQSPDGHTQIRVRLDGQALWLTQLQLADLFQSTPQNITQHIRALYAEGELQEAATCKPYLQVRQEGGHGVSRSLKHYKPRHCGGAGLTLSKIKPTPSFCLG